MIENKTSRGFTLIELLVASSLSIVMLSLLSAMVAETIGLTGRLERKDRSVADARAALDLLGRDLSGSVRRTDLPFLEGTDGSLEFYAPLRTGDGQRQLSAIRYTLTDSGLHRAVRKLNWEGSDAPAFGGNFLAMDNAPVERLAGDIIAWNVRLVDRQSGEQVEVSAGSGREIGAMIVTAAVLGNRFRELLGESGVNTLRSRLATPGATETAMSVWNASVLDPSFTEALPKIPASQVYLIERTFVLR